MSSIIGSSSQYHIRSISLPSQFTEVKSPCLSPETVPLNAEALRNELLHLVHSVNELLQSLGNQQDLLRHSTLVENTLEDSVILLDLSSRSHELLMTMRQHVMDIQSAFRRKGRGSNSLENAIYAYIGFRKKARRESLKCLKALEKMERKLNHGLLISKETRVLSEVTCLAISVSQRLFLFLAVGLDSTRGWSFFLSKKKVYNRRSKNGGDLVMNEIENVDFALDCFCHGRFEDGEGKLMMRLKSLDDGIQGLEEGINGFFRCLIRRRVSLLNILTTH
ncbi:uncharacterized protein LOC124929106 [Impatiens glandulifera]|uniref:uncharacterized protein LOC124929106 n=1 Tax=Impatiens glandulifera TaxID=253017 RepID=UPI001FB0B1C6|nr:uncharacterized protein LOC124929106 [Impatiens glandulifera]